MTEQFFLWGLLTIGAILAARAYFVYPTPVQPNQPTSLVRKINAAWERAVLQTEREHDLKPDYGGNFSKELMGILVTADDYRAAEHAIFKPADSTSSLSIALNQNSGLSSGARPALENQLFWYAVESGERQLATRLLALLGFDEYYGVGVEKSLVDPEFSALGKDGILVLLDAANLQPAQDNWSDLYLAIARAFPQFRNDGEARQIASRARAWYMENRDHLIIDPGLFNPEIPRVRDGRMFIDDPAAPAR